MAGLYSFFGPRDDARLHRAADELQFADDETRFLLSADGFNLVWTGINDAALFGPALDPDSGVHVITAGRVSWEEPDWQRAETFTSFEGGLSNQLLLDAYLKGGPAALERHNGPALLVVWDPRDRHVHAFTDHLGYHPAFLYRPEDPNGCVLATHADVMASDPFVSVTPDLVTMAEMLRFWRPTPPHTYYQEIKYAGPATHWTWDLNAGTAASEEYWTPYQVEPYPDLQTASDALAEALRESVRIRTLPRLGPTAVYISGGMDSRTILFGAADPSSLFGINLYDVPNVEARISKQICDAANVEYVGYGRDFDYYPRWMSESARMSGGMWSTEDSHFLGTADLVAERGARTVMTGCTADLFFKAYTMEFTYKRLAGRNLPLKELSPKRVDAYPPNRPAGTVSGPLMNAMSQRLDERFGGFSDTYRSDSDRLAVEDLRVRPACYGCSVSGPGMYRFFAYDTFLADRAVVDCYDRLRPEWKVNSLAWGRAVANVSGSHRDIGIANLGWNLDDSPLKKLAGFGKGWIRRRLHKAESVEGQGPATEGSWPNLGWYVENSETLRGIWESASLVERERLTELWGEDPWSHSLTYWAEHAADLFRILTLLTHWRSNPTLQP